MSKRNPLRAKVLLIPLYIFLISQASWAQINDWRPELLPPSQREFRTSTDEFRIFIPPEVPIEVLQRLSLEMDGIDVTKMVSREGNYAIFVPPQLLGWGEHTLRLVEYAPDGTILERGLWTFEVRKSVYFREAEFQGNLDMMDTRRVADHNLGNLPKHNQAQGGAGLHGALGNGNWRVSGSGDFLYNSQSDQNFNDREFDIGEFLFTGKVGPARLDVGHQAIESYSMVMEGFNRRGVSASLLPESQRARVTAFIMRTESITGFQYGLGINDSDKRVRGVVGSAFPLPSNPERLFLSAVYLSGEGEEIGVGESGNSESAGGDAWSLTADSSILDRRLRLRGEYAVTRFDFDGIGTGFSAERDHAYSLLAVYTPPEKSIKGNPLRFSLGLEDQRIGTFFHSLANSELPGDKRLVRVFTELSWSGLSLNALLGRETDNVEGIAALPRVRTDQINVAVVYSPLKVSQTEDSWIPFGQPSYNIAFGQIQQKQITTPAGFSGTETDNRTRELSLSAAFNPGGWNWAIGHTITLFDDNSDVYPDTRNNLTNLSAGLQIGERLSLTPDAQYNVLEDNYTGVDTTSLLTSLGITFILYPERLNGSMNFSLNRDSTSDNSTDTITNTFDANIVWTFKLPKPNRPGFALFLNGNYQDISDHITASASTHNYQVFSGVKVIWWLAY